jgi:hypothetical protein
MFNTFKKLFITVDDIKETNDQLRIINQLQNNIYNSITSIIKATQNDSIVLQNITLISGQINTINHTLNRKLKGWYLSRVRGKCQVYDVQDTNKSQELTLLLNTDTTVVVDLVVF